VFDLSSLLTGVTVAIDTANSSSTPQTFFVPTGSQQATPYGTFTNGIAVNGGNGSGSTVGNNGPLYFTITATGGITLADLLATGGYFFAADVFGTGGNTGSVAANMFSCVAGCTGNAPPPPGETPLPGAVWLFGTALAALTGFRKLGKRDGLKFATA
jgi:hypothetical protein